MKIRGKSVLRKLIWLLPVIVFMGQQSPVSTPKTRADSPGFGVLEQARQLKADQKFRQAAEKALQAARIFQQQSDWTNWIGCYEVVLHSAYGENTPAYFQEVIGYFTAAAQLLNNTTAAPPRAKALIWSWQGTLHHTLGDYEPAISFYEKALPFAEQAADSVLLPKLYTNVAAVSWLLGDDYRALRFHEKALVLATLQRDTPLIGVITVSLGNVWRTLDPPKAVAFYRQALQFDPDNPETLMLLSKAYEEGEKNYAKALEAARAALRLAEYDTEKSDVLHQLGRVYDATRQHDRALDFYRQALTFGAAGYGAQHPECAKIHVFRGHAWLQKNEFDQALLAYNQTLDDLLPLFSPRSAEQNPTEAEMTTISLWILEALLGKARVYAQKFQRNRQVAELDLSLACADRALVYLNKIKLRYGDDNSKLALNDYVREACEAALRAAHTLYVQTGEARHARRAFQISEQTKAVVLAEALYKKEVKRIAGIPPALLEQERKCHEQIAGFEKKLTDSEVYKDSLFWAKRQRETLEKQLEENYPQYRRALVEYRDVVHSDSVRRQLPADAALLEYFLGDSTLYTFLLTRDTFCFLAQTLPGNFTQTFADFRRTVNDWSFSTDSSAVASRLFLESGRRLFESLLEKPLALTALPRLFIVPDGPLHYLPFELLLTQPYTGQWIDRDVPFLLKQRSVSYRFSCRANPALPLSEGWGGFGMEYDNRTLSVLEQDVQPDGESRMALRNYGKLPYADDEIRAVSGILGGAFWLNDQATRKNFLQHAGQYGILHLAMHGFVDEQNPLRSRLLFSKSVAEEDPFVYASDLYGMQLTAGLAVLSACQSGAGAWKRGEGVMSLARAFAFAGCPSLVMSLWNVSDQSTADLMVAFYQQLREGKNKDEALRFAKLQYLQTVSPEYAKPVYWAGFVPVGEMEALPAGYFSNGSWSAWWWLGLILVAMIVISALFVINRH